MIKIPNGLYEKIYYLIEPPKNKISYSDNLIILRAREFGLNFLQKVKPVKYLLMRYGLG